MGDDEIQNDKLFESLFKKLKKVPYDKWEFVSQSYGDGYRTKIGDFDVDVTKWKRSAKKLWLKENEYSVDYKQVDENWKDWKLMKDPEAKVL